jgi:hypothetical protein
LPPPTVAEFTTLGHALEATLTLRLKVVEAAGMMSCPVASSQVTLCPTALQAPHPFALPPETNVNPVGKTSDTEILFWPVPEAVAVPVFLT